MQEQIHIFHLTALTAVHAITHLIVQIELESPGGKQISRLRQILKVCISMMT